MHQILQALKDFDPQANVPMPSFNVPLSPRLLANMRKAILDADAPLIAFAMDNSVWADFLTDSTYWKELFSPVKTREAVVSGYLGDIFGAPILTDAYEAVPDKFIGHSRLYAVSLDAQGRLYRVVGASIG